MTNYVISVYSSEEVEVEQIPNYSYQNILEKIYISCANKKKINRDSSINDISINNYNDYTNNNENTNYNNSFKKVIIQKAPKIIKYTESTLEGYSYIYIENNEEDITLVEDVNYKNFEGYILLPPYSSGRFHVEVKPGENKIILIKRLELIESNNNIVFYRSNLLYGNKTLYKLTKKKGIKKKREDKETGKEVDINVEKQKEIKINLPPHQDYFLDLRSKSLLWKVNPVFTYTIEKLNNIEENENEKQNSEKSQSESKSFSNKDNNENNENNERDFYKKEQRSRSLRTNSPSSIRNDENYNDNENENDIEKKDLENQNENVQDIEESFEKAGDSSDVSASDEKSEDSNEN